MSFLSNPKTAGNAFEIIGILEIIGGIFAIIDGVIHDDIDTTFAVVIGIGAIICGLIIAFYGNKVRNGVISEKIDILAAFVRIVGVITIITGIFLVIANVIIGADLLSEALRGIISTIIGTAEMFCGLFRSMSRITWCRCSLMCPSLMYKKAANMAEAQENAWFNGRKTCAWRAVTHRQVATTSVVRLPCGSIYNTRKGVRCDVGSGNGMPVQKVLVSLRKDGVQLLYGEKPDVRKRGVPVLTIGNLRLKLFGIKQSGAVAAG